jgi:uncharacterized protein
MEPRTLQRASRPGPIPTQAGIGLRVPHHAQILAERPAIAWLEAHSENYFARGGALPQILARIREHYPLSLHGVGLSIGSADALDTAHLGELRRLIAQCEPALVSEHLCWGALGGRSTNDLLPLPYTEEALRHLIVRVGQVQDFLGRQILIENVSSYLQFRCSTLSEWEFLAALAQEARCGVLLDINNVYVNAMNHGFDAATFIAALPRGAVLELHLAGHSVAQYAAREIRIDTHGTPVCEAVWSLYRLALERFGAIPTLIEWDTDIPSLEVLQAEAAKAQAILGSAHAVAA